jgi:hypothetical protein
MHLSIENLLLHKKNEPIYSLMEIHNFIVNFNILENHNNNKVITFVLLIFIEF